MAEVDGIAVFVRAPVPFPTEIMLTGVLHEDRHIDAPVQTPLTTGRIRSVWPVSWNHRREGGAWHRLDNTVRLSEIQKAPEHLPSEAPPDRADCWRSTDAVLVNLEILPRTDSTRS